MGTSWIEGNGLVFGCGSVGGKWVEMGGNDKFSITVAEAKPRMPGVILKEDWRS